MEEKLFDVVVIGGGPGGYVAAIKAAQLGMQVACVEKRGALGGTCLNVGCIPSKAMLESSKIYEKIQHEAESHGVKISKVELDLEAMLKRKDNVVSSLCKGIEGLFKKNNVSYYKGAGSIKSKDIVEVEGQDKTKISLKAKNIIIATGSEVTTIPGIEIDEKVVVSSTGALELKKVPNHLVVIGGGYIGLEMGSVWRRLGAEVTVVEFLDKIVPAMDEEIGRNFQRLLEKQGIKFMLGTKVLSSQNNGKKAKLALENVKTGAKTDLETDVVLVAVGRKPHTLGLGLETVGISLDNRGRIEVDQHFRTKVPNIYAIGDVIAGPMLAHKAEEEGVAAVEIIAGQAGHVNYNTIPGVVYTWPEVATVGKTEEELKALNVDYKVGKFPFLANSRAKAIDDTDGMVKILACSKTDEILGVHIIAAEAGTMIAEAVVAMEYKAASEDLARICHAHPTLNEAVKEAAMAVTFKAIHI